MSTYKSYIICGTPRSGSTLLCGMLEDAGCGVPESYFRRQSITGIARDLGVENAGDIDKADFSRRYIEAILKAGRGGSDVFALRLMYENLEELSDRLDRVFPGLATAPERFERAFGRPLYIHLSREDKVAQAVSLFKALQTGLWHIAADGSEIERTAPHQEAAFDADRLSAIVAELQRHDAAWTEWFATHGIEPVRLTYDGLSKDPQAGLRAILAGLGLDPSIASQVKPQTAKLADRQSLDWIAQLRPVAAAEDVKTD